MPSQIHPRWIIPGLIGITVLAYGQTLYHGFFTLDDTIYASKNIWVQGGLTWANFEWALSSTVNGFWQPVLWWSLQLDASLYGGNGAWGFHLTNLLWHLANVVLVFLVFARMTERIGLSAMVAALFAIHPLHVEAVAWISARKDVLSGFFWLVALGIYLRYAARPSWVSYLAMMLALALSLMTKPMAVTFPCVLFLLDIWPLRRLACSSESGREKPRFQPASLGWLFWEKVPLLFLTLIFAWLTVWTSRTALNNIIDPIPLPRRLGNAFIAYVWYLLKTFWPVNLGLYYPYPSADQTGWLAPIAASILVGITWGAWKLRHRQPALGIGWLWFVGMLVPVIGLVASGELIADRWTYLPHLGLFLGLVWGLADWGPWTVKTRASLAVIVVIACLTLTIRQVSFWQENTQLWEHSLAINGDNFRVHDHLGYCYSIQGDPDRAEEHFARAMSINPRSGQAGFYYQYAKVLLKKGKLDQAESYAQESMRLLPGYPPCEGLLGQVLVARGQFRAALPFLENGVRNTDSEEDTFSALGITLWQLGRSHQALQRMDQLLVQFPHLASVHQVKGLVLLNLEDYSAAQAAFLQALQIQPDFPDAHGYLGITLGRMGKKEEAVIHLAQAVRLQPEKQDWHADLAYILFQQGQLREATEEYRKVLGTDPHWPENSCARALRLVQANADVRDPLRALDLALQVCQATGFKEPRWMNTLAVVYAANGHATEARETSRKALDLDPSPDLRRELEERLRE